MELKRTSHAVYDTKYHLVWAPKYRKWILRGDVRERMKEISNTHDFEIDTLEIAPDHVHIFLSLPPPYSISKMVGMLRSISASIIFKEQPEAKKSFGAESFGKTDILPEQLVTKLPQR